MIYHVLCVLVRLNQKCIHCWSAFYLLCEIAFGWGSQDQGLS